jgi:hypothetical protein
MAKSKLAGAQKKPAAAPKRAKPSSEAEQPVTPALRRGAPSGGRGGKRSDPDYVATTFFVRKETRRAAQLILIKDAETSMDLSDVVEGLLTVWIARHSSS